MSISCNVEYEDQIRQSPVEAFSFNITELYFSGRNSSRMDMTICLGYALIYVSSSLLIVKLYTETLSLILTFILFVISKYLAVEKHWQSC